LATSVGIEGLCGMSGWQARHFSELPVHITGCQGSTTTTTTITMITAPAFDSFKGPGSEYCAEDGMISESGSLGQHDCESRCTADPACKYISLWASGGLSWCRLNTACETFSQQSRHTINIFRKATLPGRRLVTTTTTTITAPAFESFKGPGSEYCAEDGMISESGSLGQHDCESRCTAHPACNYISLWASGGLSWCRLNTACEIFSQQSGHTINVFEKATPPGRRLAQLQMDVSGGSVFV